MGNWVIVCHGGVDKDGGNVQIPQGVELHFWVNEGKPAYVGQAKFILTELMRDPDPETIRPLIDKAWPGVDWSAVSGSPGQWTEALWLQGDPQIDTVGQLNLETRKFTRWSTTNTVSLKTLLSQLSGTVHLICCRTDL